MSDDIQSDHNNKIEDVSEVPLSVDADAALCSIAISLKRLADHHTDGLIELPLKSGGVAHIRFSQVSNVSANGHNPGMAFVQMIGDGEQTGFTVALSVDEVIMRFRLPQKAL